MEIIAFMKSEKENLIVLNRCGQQEVKAGDVYIFVCIKKQDPNNQDVDL